MRRVQYAASLATFAFLALSATAHGQTLFAGELHPSATPPGTPLTDFAIGDIDGDGKRDLVSAHLQWRRGDGLGGFAAPLSAAPLPSGVYMGSGVGLGDVNRDGRDDLLLVVASGPQAVWVYHNLGGGVFAAPSPHPLSGAGSTPRLGKFDGDDWPDLALIVDGAFTVLRNDGAGGFLAPVTLPSPLSSYVDLVLGDIDGDGDDDAVLANNYFSPFGPSQASDAEVWLCNGQGGFSLHARLGVDRLGARVDLADLDGDGDLDLLSTTDASSGQSWVRRRLNLGGAAFGAAQESVIDGVTDQVRAADVDGDGHVEVIVFVGATGVATVLDVSPSGSLSAAGAFAVGAVKRVEAAEVDGDRSTDLVGLKPDFAAGVFVFGSRTASGLGSVVLGTSNLSLAAVSGDIDGDLDPDLVMGSRLLINDGNGVFTAGSVLPNPLSLWSNTLGDIDGDGDLDLLRGNGTFSVTVLANNGAGVFTAAGAVPVGVNSRWIALHDLDGDLDLDLFTLNRASPSGASGSSVCLGNGLGAFGAPTLYGQLNRSESAAFGDFNGDGRVDIAVAHWFGVRVTLLPSGAGAPTVVDTPLGLPNTYAYDIAAADADADGALDVVLACTSINPSGCSAVVLHGNGTGAFPTRVQHAALGLAASSVVAQELDGDGVIDIALLGGKLDTVNFLRGNGAGFDAPRGFATTVSIDEHPDGLLALDVDLDGRMDLATCGALMAVLRRAPDVGDVGVYCTAKSNSIGCAPRISAVGTPSASASSGFVVASSNGVNQSSGLLFYGLNGSTATPFVGGTRCVAAALKRTPVQNSGGTAGAPSDCSGAWSLDLNAFAAGVAGGSPDPALSVAGSHVHAQWWGRDPLSPAHPFALSDALQYFVQP